MSTKRSNLNVITQLISFTNLQNYVFDIMNFQTVIQSTFVYPHQVCSTAEVDQFFELLFFSFVDKSQFHLIGCYKVKQTQNSKIISTFAACQIQNQSPIHIINLIFVYIGAMQGDNQPQPDQHAIWMENAGFLYDRLLIQKLKWPSLTFQWLPFREESSLQTTYHCLYGTHSSGNAQSQHLYIAQVIFPALRDLNEEPKDLQASRMKAIYRFTHEDEINKARHCPEDSSLIAARTDQGPVCVFKYGNQYPAFLLDGSLNGGFSLEWSFHGILSGDFTGKACYWSNAQARVQEVNYGNNVEDVKIVENGLAVIVGDSGLLSFWDLRTNSIIQSVQAARSEKRQLYSVAVNPIQKNIVLTGGQDGSIRLWDRRNLSIQLHNFQGHEGNIMNLEWSPVNSIKTMISGSVFASGATDKKVKIWDLMRVGFQIPKDLGGTDELLFTHEGHKGAINDLGWNPYQMILGSAEEDQNTLQFYQITNNIHELQYAQDMEYLRQQCFS